ncbi:acyl-CoA dehydrogenase family protein [Ferrimonas lipolytica]|uniref:Acyl-CoA dehydrogenase n=1 Tax=Ferrimonas lipolytica TaxID=2724191 RepID=A0A6H1UDV4_9GAMM|nr:acyl-CoA dehydrogenase family protein [Ferrimonas lipolytica]QIZ77287.1 acyl-CoA dehydrogenase [Ferrimonas lipolytica]
MIPRTIFTEEHEQFRTSVRRFLENEAVPFHHQWEQEGQVSRELWLKAGELGMLAPMTPEAYGGLELDYRYNAIVDEEIALLGLTGIGFGLHSDIGVPYIVNFGSEEQKQEYLPRCISGEIITAIAMTEPGAGSDLQGIRTTAVKDGDDYIINGSKTFITNGQMADLVIVVAKTDPTAGARGTSLFLIEAGTAGFEKGQNLHKLGMKAQDTSELFFNDVRVPKTALLGEEGKGFIYLMQELPQERLNIAINAVGSMQGVMTQTIAYVKERQAFGKSVATFQNTQFTLADLDAKLSMMQVYIDRCLELHINKRFDAVEAAKAKLVSTELQGELIDACLQLHGGYGYMWEYPVGRAFVDARVQRIYGGTNEIMKLIIGRDLIKDD